MDTTDKIVDALKSEADAVLEDAQSAATMILDLVKKIEEIPARIKAAAQLSLEAADETYLEIKKAHEKLAIKTGTLEKLPGLEVPYGVERLIEVAQKCEDLSDTSWTRLRELAVALRDDRDQEIEASRKREKEEREQEQG
jgi:hypothetical protein